MRFAKSGRTALLAPACAAAFVAAAPAPAGASTLPAPDSRTETIFGTGVGAGFGMSIDGNVTGDTRLGVALGMSIPLGVVPSYEIRLAHWIRTGMRDVGFSIYAGAFGIGPRMPLGMELGPGMSFDLTPRLTARANAVFGTDFISGLIWAPSAGAELGYRFSRTLEGTLGFNARGEILGINVRI